MAGPAPKPPELRQRVNRVAGAATLILSSPLAEGELPALPARHGPRGGRRTWRPEVVAWWADVWASPMASEYVQADVHGLVLLAELLDQFWRKPSTYLASEIRLQRQCFGLTPIDRRRLQWEVQRGEEAERKRQPAPPVAPAADPRDVLRVVV